MRSHYANNKTFDDNADMFLTFMEEFKEWTKTGKEPESADQDLKFYLDLQENRLKKYGISKKVSYEMGENDKPILRAGEIPKTKYTRGLRYLRCKETDEYFGPSGSKLYKRKRPVLFCETIIDRCDDRYTARTNYTCPNCGSISTVRELLDGCRYCNSKFIMRDLYPKVNNFFCIETERDQKDIKKEAAIFAAVGAAILFTIFLIIKGLGYGKGTVSLAEFLITIFAAGAGGGMLGGLVVWGIKSVFKAFIMTGKSLTLLIASWDSKSRLDNMVSEIDPELDYEYFEGKVLSLLRSIIFSEDETKLIQYDGTPIDRALKNIIDVSFRGVVAVNSIKRVKDVSGEENIEVNVKIFAENLYYMNSRLKLKAQRMYMTMRHRAQKRIEPYFSIKKVSCLSCGGSFDATRQTHCPYCNMEYDAQIEDWVVTDVTAR